MVLSVAEIEQWDPEALREIFSGANTHAVISAEVADSLGQLPAFRVWGGMVADAATDAIGKTRVDLGMHGQEAATVARAADIAADGVQKVRDDLHALQRALDEVQMTINPVTNTVVPGPGFSGNPMQLMLATAQYQPVLDGIIGEANGVDAELTHAIEMADGRMPIPNAPPGTAVDRKMSGGPDDSLGDPATSTGPSVLANVQRANDRAVIEAMQRVKAAQQALDQASATAYTHGAGSPEAEAALAQLPKLKQDLADALNDLGKIPDYSHIDPNAISLSPNGNLLFSYLANGQMMQVTGMLKNGTGEIFDQGTKAYYTYQNGKLVGTRFLDEGRAIATNEPLLTAVTTVVGAGPMVKGGEAGWLGLRALFGREGADALTSVTADNVLPHAGELAAARSAAAVQDLAVRGPGAWGPSHEAFTGFSQAYQEFVTGRSISEAYIVEGAAGPVKFDGFLNGALIDAKGDYGQFILPNGEWKGFFPGDGYFLGAAARHMTAAGDTPIVWPFAQAEAAEKVGELLRTNGITQIACIWKPVQ